MRASWFVGWSLLVLSVATAAALAYTSYHYYERSVSNRLAPNAVRAGDQSADIQFIGDSRVAQWARRDTLNAGYTGFPGATSNQILAHYLANPAAVPYAKRIVLQLGINDLRTLGMRPERTTKITAATCDAITQLVKRLAANDNRITLLAIFPTGPLELARRLVWSEEIPKAVNLVNTCLTQTSWPQNVSLLDTGATLRAIHDTAYTDALHLSDSGYAAVNKTLHNRLR